MNQKINKKYILILSLIFLVSCFLYLISFINTNTSNSNINSFEKVKDNTSVTVTSESTSTKENFILLSETENKQIQEEQKNTQQNINNTKTQSKTQEKKVLSEIILEAGSLKTNLSFVEGDTLYQILEKAKTEEKIIFENKNFPMLGFFVTQIGELKEGNGKYLFYNINSKEAQVGVSSYKPSDGDIITWELK